ncbi:MAG: MmgE/PrpD family protein [Thermodesulfobacteriota bacterium]|nr:MmgE/PrpD family protein [Thermodesulfobacteriota bacterium]
MSTEKIARFIVETSYEDLPAEAIGDAKEAILDCIGVTLAGNKEPGVRYLADYVKEERGIPEAGIFGYGFKSTASQAAWVNGTMAHVLDYDDYSAFFLGHPTVALLPAALAMGEKYRLSGKDVLLSYIIGFEVGAKIGPVCLQHYLVGWHVTSTIGSIGAAALAAKLLNLNIDEVKMTLGIAGSLASGLKQNFGTMTKSFHAGNAARNGIVAALLAQKGFTADKSILESPQGFCKTFAGGSDLELDKIGEGLGERYDIIKGIVIKPWPSCGGTHTTIEAALTLREKHGVKPEDVKEIELRTSEGIRTATIHSRPKTGLEGKFSNEYCLSRALIDGEVNLTDFTDERVMQKEAQELIPKIHYVHPKEMQEDMFQALASEIVVTRKDGSVVSHKIMSPKGEKQNPLGWEGISTKFKDCANVVLSSQDTETCMDIFSNLELTEDITQLMSILTSGSK